MNFSCEQCRELWRQYAVATRIHVQLDNKLRSAALQGAFEANARSQFSAGRLSENVFDIKPRFEATSAPNPVTVGGLPISATFG
jgi:hypothetical protein